MPSRVKRDTISLLFRVTNRSKFRSSSLPRALFKTAADLKDKNMVILKSNKCPIASNLCIFLHFGLC